MNNSLSLSTTNTSLSDFFLNVLITLYFSIFIFYLYIINQLLDIISFILQFIPFLPIDQPIHHLLIHQPLHYLLINQPTHHLLINHSIYILFIHYLLFHSILNHIVFPTLLYPIVYSIPSQWIHLQILSTHHITT